MYNLSPGAETPKNSPERREPGGENNKNAVANLKNGDPVGKGADQWQPADRFVRVRSGLRRDLGRYATDFERRVFEVVCCLRFADGGDARHPDGWHGGARLLAECFRDFYGRNSAPRPRDIRRAVERLAELGALVVTRRAIRGQAAGFYLLACTDRASLNGGSRDPHSRGAATLSMGGVETPINGGSRDPHTGEQENDPKLLALGGPAPQGHRADHAGPTVTVLARVDRGADPIAETRAVRSNSAIDSGGLTNYPPSPADPDYLSPKERSLLGAAQGFAPPPPTDADAYEEPDLECEDTDGLSLLDREASDPGSISTASAPGDGRGSVEADPERHAGTEGESTDRLAAPTDLRAAQEKLLRKRRQHERALMEKTHDGANTPTF